LPQESELDLPTGSELGVKRASASASSLTFPKPAASDDDEAKRRSRLKHYFPNRFTLSAIRTTYALAVAATL
jgi:hypothetical protein